MPVFYLFRARMLSLWDERCITRRPDTFIVKNEMSSPVCAGRLRRSFGRRNANASFRSVSVRVVAIRIQISLKGRRMRKGLALERKGRRVNVVLALIPFNFCSIFFFCLVVSTRNPITSSEENEIKRNENSYGFHFVGWVCAPPTESKLSTLFGRAAR